MTLDKRDHIITRAGGEIYSTAPFTKVLITIWPFVVMIKTYWYYQWPPKSDFQIPSPFKLYGAIEEGIVTPF